VTKLGPLDVVESRDRDLFDRIATEFARKDELRAMVPARRHRVESLVTQYRDLGTVLDAGCGGGAQAMYLAGHYTRYVGIDQSTALIEHARAGYGNLAHVTFIAANIKEITIADTNGPADTILMMGGLHHMTNRLSLLRHVFALGRPGALFACLEPSASNPLVQVLRRLRQQIDKAYSNDQIQFRPGALRALLVEAGLEEVTLRRHGWFSPPFAQVNLHSEAACRAAVALDRLCDRLQFPWAWNLLATGFVPPSA
jgi:SAM-dependent methyltransferase